MHFSGAYKHHKFIFNTYKKQNYLSLHVLSIYLLTQYPYKYFITSIQFFCNKLITYCICYFIHIHISLSLSLSLSLLSTYVCLIDEFS